MIYAASNDSADPTPFEVLLATINRTIRLPNPSTKGDAPDIGIYKAVLATDGSAFVR